MSTIEELLAPELKQRLEIMGQEAKGERSEKGMRGRCKWFNQKKGWGFITSESGKDYFVHWRDIVGKDRRSLKPGQEVCFDIGEDARGRTRAIMVEPLVTAGAGLGY